MFKERRTEKKYTGTRLVPFCNDCNSQHIETVQYCKDCGSHNIKADWTDDRSRQDQYKEVETFVFWCDKCNKEFTQFTSSNVISYINGEFVLGNCEDAESTTFIEGDYCQDCMDQIVRKLNKQIEDLTRPDNVKSICEEYLKKQ